MISECFCVRACVSVSGWFAVGSVDIDFFDLSLPLFSLLFPPLSVVWIAAFLDCFSIDTLDRFYMYVAIMSISVMTILTWSLLRNCNYIQKENRRSAGQVR